MISTRRTYGLIACLVLLGLGRADAAPFTPGDLVIYRVGSGTGSLLNSGNPVFLDEYTQAGILVQSIALPTAASGANQALIASGTASSEGLLNLSTDGQYLSLTGYDASPGGPSLAGTAATAVPRTVAIVDSFGNVNTSTALTDFASGNNPRSAITTDGTDIYVTGGAGGVRFATEGSTTSTQLSTTVTNLRDVDIVGGQLYVSTASGSAVRIGAVGTGLPTTPGQTITSLPGFPTSTGSPYAFTLLSLPGGPAGNNTLYVADDSTTGGGIQKYSLVNGSFVATGTITAPAVRGLTAEVIGSTVTLFGTTGGTGAAGGGTLYAFTDTTGYDGTAAGAAAAIATAAANEAFRGIAFAPTTAAVPEPSSLALLAVGAAGLVARARLRRREAD